MAEHAYVSTACQHQLHQQCRRMCKFCPAGCGCVCHGTGKRSPAPLDASRVDPYDTTKGGITEP